LYWARAESAAQVCPNEIRSLTPRNCIILAHNSRKRCYTTSGTFVTSVAIHDPSQETEEEREEDEPEDDEEQQEDHEENYAQLLV
jgi:hypothetical protein